MGFQYESLFKRLLANSVEDESTPLFRGSHCWCWSGFRTRRGYGRISRRVEGRESPVGHAAHRVMAEIIMGRPLHPDNETIEHACGLPWCINYAHLDVGSRAENTADMRARLLGKPRKAFRPLVDPALYVTPEFVRELPRRRDAARQDCPF